MGKGDMGEIQLFNKFLIWSEVIGKYVDYPPEVTELRLAPARSELRRLPPPLEVTELRRLRVTELRRLSVSTPIRRKVKIIRRYWSHTPPRSHRTTPTTPPRKWFWNPKYATVCTPPPPTRNPGYAPAHYIVYTNVNNASILWKHPFKLA